MIISCSSGATAKGIDNGYAIKARCYLAARKSLEGKFVIHRRQINRALGDYIHPSHMLQDRLKILGRRCMGHGLLTDGGHRLFRRGDLFHRADLCHRTIRILTFGRGDNAGLVGTSEFSS